MLTNIATATSNPTDTDMIAVKDSVRTSPGMSLRGKKNISPEQMDSVAQDFEAQFISQMLSNMFNTVDTKESLGGSDSEEVYRSMLTNEYGKIIAKTGGLGVADQVKRMMISQQEVEK